MTSISWSTMNTAFRVPCTPGGTTMLPRTLARDLVDVGGAGLLRPRAAGGATGARSALARWGFAGASAPRRAWRSRRAAVPSSAPGFFGSEAPRNLFRFGRLFSSVLPWAVLSWVRVFRLFLERDVGFLRRGAWVRLWAARAWAEAPAWAVPVWARVSVPAGAWGAPDEVPVWVERVPVWARAWVPAEDPGWVPGFWRAVCGRPVVRPRDRQGRGLADFPSYRESDEGRAAGAARQHHGNQSALPAATGRGRRSGKRLCHEGLKARWRLRSVIAGNCSSAS